MRSRRMPICLFTICLFISACSHDETAQTHSFKITKENGVPVALTTIGPKYNQELFRYEEVLRLNQDTTKVESLLYLPERFRIDENGYFFVDDVGNSRIAVFDPSGNYSHQIGRKGNGPGEFQYPRTLFVRDGLIAVKDFNPSRTSVFSTSGTLLHILTAPATSTGLDAVYPGLDEIFVYIFNRYFRQSEQPYLQWHHVSIVSSVVDTIADFDTPRTETGFSSGTMIMSHIYVGRPITLYIPGQGVLTTTGREPVFELYGLDGHKKRVIRAKIEGQPVTDDERVAIDQTWQERLRLARGERGRERVKRQLQIMNIPQRKDFWSEVIVDEFGYIWAGEPILMYLQPEDGRMYRVFSPEGEYLGNTMWSHFLWSTPSRGHLLAMVYNRETGETTPIVYRIIPAVEGLKYP